MTRFRGGFVAGYLAALATCAALIVRLAYQPAAKWWR